MSKAASADQLCEKNVTGVYLLQGDGRVVMATREYMLGEQLPDLHITFWVGCHSHVSAS